MTAYLDASLVVAAYTDETHSDRAGAFLAGLGANELVVSDWCETEIASGLALKVRIGVLTTAARLATGRVIAAMLRASAVTVPIRRMHFRAAAVLLEQSALPLRGGDTLHLAIAADHGATLWTLDRRMAAAGEALGLDICLLT